MAYDGRDGRQRLNERHHRNGIPWTSGTRCISRTRFPGTSVARRPPLFALPMPERSTLPSSIAAAAPASTRALPHGAWMRWALTFADGHRSRRQKAAVRGLNADFQVGDVLALDRFGRASATIIDPAFPHLHDADRVRYVASLASVLQHGGVLHVLALSELTPGERRPRRVTRAEFVMPLRMGGRSSGSRLPSSSSDPTGRRRLCAAGWRESFARARPSWRPSPRSGAALPSRSGAGQLVAGFLAGIGHPIENRPRAVPQIEEAYRDPWATTEGPTWTALMCRWIGRNRPTAQVSPLGKL